MASNKLVLRVTGLPEAMWSMRHILANLLREEASDAPRDTADRLLAIAARFEAGIASEGDVDDQEEETWNSYNSQ